MDHGKLVGMLCSEFVCFRTISVDMYTFEHWFTVEVVKVKKMGSLHKHL